MKKLILCATFMAITTYTAEQEQPAKASLEHVKKFWDDCIEDGEIHDAAAKAKIMLDAFDAVAKTHPTFVNSIDNLAKAARAFFAECERHHENLLKLHPEYATFCKESGFKPRKKDEKKS